MVGDLSAWLGRPLPRHSSGLPTAGGRAAAGEGPRATLSAGKRAPHANAGRGETARSSRVRRIAIVGMGCRFPARTMSKLLQLLRDGVDAITEVPAGRWGTAHSTRRVASCGGRLSEALDARRALLRRLAREAAQIDPQQRLLLEVAWEALEDAGYAPDGLGGTQTGVFVGISNSDYAQLQFNTDESPDAYAGTGTALSINANRLSYLLDLRGPSMAVDTACSSSLVAVHAACRSLRAGESRLALAGGVNLCSRPN